jgi:hypothetical protein
MSIAWIAPAALFGVALVALPIAIHLLVRQHARTLEYPSLRFLRETQLAALRRRTIQDALLLLCRAAIVALAAVALAGPILQTASRTAASAQRTSRAVIALDGSDAGLISTLTEGTFASAAFTRSALADALIDALRWIDQQPPSSREVVIAGTLRKGVVSEADLVAIPKDIGVRFVPVPVVTVNDVKWPVLAHRSGGLVRIDHLVRFETDETRFTEGPLTDVPDDLVTIVARAEDDPLAQAALRAALEAGVAWSDFERRIVIAWGGADPTVVARGGSDVLRMPVPAPPSAAADAVLAALNALSPRPEGFEPVMITPEQLSSWSRAPGAPATDAPVADEGDRRWLWGMALVLLLVEAWMRRSAATVNASTRENGEARVA